MKSKTKTMIQVNGELNKEEVEAISLTHKVLRKIADLLDEEILSHNTDNEDIKIDFAINGCYYHISSIAYSDLVQVVDTLNCIEDAQEFQTSVSLAEED